QRVRCGGLRRHDAADQASPPHGTTKLIAYLDCFAGASGDMILGALVDAGADLGVVESQLSGLDVAFEITFSTVQRCGLRACRVDVRDAPGGASVMRTYADALALLEGAALEPAVASRRSEERRVGKEWRSGRGAGRGQ